MVFTRKLALIILVVFLLSIIPAFSIGETEFPGPPIVVYTPKNIIYVSKYECTRTGCSCLDSNSEDRIFCERINNTLGYNVIVHWENSVKDNTQEWKQDVFDARMIFLGDVSENMADKTKDRDAFCDNIPSNKQVFATFLNAYKNGDIEGCAFYKNMVDYDYDDNICSGKTGTKKNFYRIKSGYITEDLEGSGPFDILTNENNVMIHGSAGSQKGWVGIYCDPPGDPVTGTYSILNTSSKGAFWGLDKPSDFTSLTWKIFDRTIFTVMDETSWDVTGTTIPQYSTAGNNIWIISKVTWRKQIIDDSDGNVKFTIKEKTYGTLHTGDMYYEDNFWKNLTTVLPKRDIHNVTIKAFSKSGIRGYKTFNMYVGNLSIYINSKDYYTPGSGYLFSASVWSGKDPIDVSSLNYRIRASNFTVVSSGTMGCGGNTCDKIITPGYGWGTFILEVYKPSTNLDNTGGSFKTVSKEIEGLTLTTDKDEYAPLENINISLNTGFVVDSANITILKPDGSPLAEDIDMNQITPTYWNLVYSLTKDVPKGVFTIKAKITYDNVESEVSKDIEIIPWKIYVSTDKYYYNTSESINLTIETTEVYDPKLNFTLDIDVSNNETLNFTTTTIEGEDIFETTYDIPDDFDNGIYTFLIHVNDSDGRTDLLTKDFSINYSVPGQEFSVSPSYFSVITIADKIIEKEFTLENGADVTATYIIVDIPDELSDIVSVKSKPSSISANGADILELEIDTTGLDEDTYSGIIDISSSVGEASITGTIEVVGDLIAEADALLAELEDLKTEIQDLEAKGKDVSDLWSLYNETEDLLNQAKDDYYDEDYASAKSNIDQARSNISDLRTMINDLKTARADYSWLVWTVAAIVIIAVVGVLVWKYRDQVMRFIKRLIERIKGKEEEEVEEYYYKPKGEYRTEYY